MIEKVTLKSHRMLFLNALAFTVCFAVWTFNGVMITFLADNGVYNFSVVQIGWLIGLPVLSGSIFRLPMGILTDWFGGKWVFGLLLLFCAVPMYLFSLADSFGAFMLCSFGFGMAGTGFAVGIANTSVWYPREWQGRALGIFGVGNAGAAVTTLLAPGLLNSFTEGGAMQNWRLLPVIYSISLVVMAGIFLLFTENRRHHIQGQTISVLLQPLKSVMVWRFGLYYFLVFGCFVAISQWLVPYFVNAYSTSLVMAGVLASVFSLPSGLIRALGGWMADRWGARKVMLWVFTVSIVTCLLLSVPRMEVYSPGKAVTALKSGKVTFVSDSLIRVEDREYPVSRQRSLDGAATESGLLVLPAKDAWQIPVVNVGDQVRKKQPLAKGMTRIFFQANLWIFAVLVFLVGIAWGIGKAGVYRFIPDYFPDQVGVVGGMVGVIGGLGGFFCPIIFGYLLDWTGLWTSSWIFLLGLSIVCLWWMRSVIARMMRRAAPEFSTRMDSKPQKAHGK